MVLGRERKFFAGGMTPKGFVNFFEDIIGEEERERYILKGGPGTGKSRMMKKVANAAMQEGYDVELICCSADPDSLDGVRIPELGKTILDGTAPHVVEMNLPGVRDSIINLGVFWDETALKRHKKAISALLEEKALCYGLAEQCFKAAGEIQQNIDFLANHALSHGKLQQWMEQLCQQFFKDIDISYRVGSMRKMFGTAMTAKGHMNTLPSLFRGVKVYALRCRWGRGACSVLERLQEEALRRGFFVESCRCPMAPERTEHFVIPKLALAFTTYNDYHQVMDCEVFGEYSMDVYYNDCVLEPYEKELEYDCFRMQELLEKGQRNLTKAQKIHSAIESYYTATMDFDAMNQCTEHIIEKLLP